MRCSCCSVALCPGGCTPCFMTKAYSGLTRDPGRGLQGTSDHSRWLRSEQLHYLSPATRAAARTCRRVMNLRRHSAFLFRLCDDLSGRLRPCQSRAIREIRHRCEELDDQSSVPIALGLPVLLTRTCSFSVAS